MLKKRYQNELIEHESVKQTGVKPGRHTTLKKYVLKTSTGELDLMQNGSELKNIKRKTRTEENVANDLSNVNHRLEFD